AACMTDNTRPLAGYAVELSGSVDNAEWDARVALNAYLSGLSREDFVAAQRVWLDTTLWGPWAPRRGNEAARQERFQSRLASGDAVRADPTAALDRFQVRYVALPAGAPVDYLGPEWVRLQDGPHWQVWERAGYP